MKEKDQKNSLEQKEIFQIKAKNPRSLPDYEKFDYEKMSLIQILAYTKHKKGGK